MLRTNNQIIVSSQFFNKFSSINKALPNFSIHRVRACYSHCLSLPHEFFWRRRAISFSFAQGFSTEALYPTWGPRSGSPWATCRGLYSVVILQNPVDEQWATSVDSLWKGATNHERLRTTGFADFAAHI